VAAVHTQAIDGLRKMLSAITVFFPRASDAWRVLEEPQVRSANLPDPVETARAILGKSHLNVATSWTRGVRRDFDLRRG